MNNVMANPETDKKHNTHVKQSRLGNQERRLSPHGKRKSVQNEKRSERSSAFHQAQKDYLPSVNRMLVDLKKLDYFSDPNSVLFNLRNTLEECSQKQR